MIDRDSFDEHVRDALAHLYDHLYLQTHPLAAQLVARPGDQARGQTLHRVLMEAIEALKPADDTPYQSLAWRKYRYLVLRYVEEMSPGEIAEELGTSGRQGRRDHTEALSAVASRLWDVYYERRSLEQPEADDGARPPREADQRGSLIGDELARLSSTAREEPTSVRETVDGALATLEALAVSRGTTVSNAVPKDAAQLTVSRAVLRQILLGTLLLGLDRARGGRIEITTESVGREIEIRVLVTPGTSHPGPAPAPSGQEDRLMALSRLVGMHGGHLRIDEAHERDALITVRLPAAAPAAVLVIEDNPDMLRLLKRYLLAGGYRVVEASTATDAVESIRRERPAAVTLDVMMPTQDGWEILQVLKTHPQTRDVPVIVCSVLRERDLAMSLGASDLLAKPVAQRDLLEALSRCLEKERCARRRDPL